MSDQKTWETEPMNAIASVSTLAELARKVETKTMYLDNAKQQHARESIAQDAGISITTIENLLRNPPRIKIVPEGLRPALTGVLIRALRREAERAGHELDRALETIENTGAPEISEAQAALADAKEKIEKVAIWAPPPVKNGRR